MQSCTGNNDEARQSSGCKASPKFKETHGNRTDIDESTKLSDVKAPNLIERASEEIEALVHSLRPHKDRYEDATEHSKHHQNDAITNETHGRNDEINEDTPVSEVKAPNVFQRAKEEIEAIVDAIHPKN